MPQLSSNFFMEKLPKGGTEFLQAYNSSHMTRYWVSRDYFQIVLTFVSRVKLFDYVVTNGEDLGRAWLIMVEGGRQGGWWAK